VRRHTRLSCLSDTTTAILTPTPHHRPPPFLRRHAATSADAALFGAFLSERLGHDDLLFFLCFRAEAAKVLGLSLKMRWGHADAAGPSNTPPGPDQTTCTLRLTSLVSFCPIVHFQRGPRNPWP